VDRSTIATSLSPPHSLTLTDAIAARNLGARRELQTIDFIADEEPTSRTTVLTGDPSYSPLYVDVVEVPA
jgi:hypothetical protein